VIGGCVNLFFYYAGETVQRLFLPQPVDPVKAAEMFVTWQRLAVPTLGGLVAGLILYWGFRFIGPQGSSDLLEVVVAGDGRLPFRTESVKTGSALVSIATGASIGREGGITQLSATLASKLGQIFKWPPYRLRLLVAEPQPARERRLLRAAPLGHPGGRAADERCGGGDVCGRGPGDENTGQRQPGAPAHLPPSPARHPRRPWSTPWP